MAIVQISRIQHRRGLLQDLPNLASAELGYAVDARRLFIGNGTTTEGAPVEGRTEILTEFSDLFSLSSIYNYKGTAGGYEVQTGPDAQNPTLRTLQAKLDELVSVRDFGARGDGLTDDTSAIQRAISRTYTSVNTEVINNKQRTIYFPAGRYKITQQLYLPPKTKLLGDGVGSSIENVGGGSTLIITDSFGQFGPDYGRIDAQTGEIPEVSNYIVQDMQLTNYHSTLVPVMMIDGGLDMTFERVSFRGLAPGTDTADLYEAMVVVRTPGFTIGRSIRFNGCSFNNANCGIEINDQVRHLTIENCSFNFLENAVRISQFVTAGYTPPIGIKINNNLFNSIAGRSVWLYPDNPTNSITLVGNTHRFVGVGLLYPQDSDADPLTPVVEFNGDGNYIVGDDFKRSTRAARLIPNVKLNGGASLNTGVSTIITGATLGLGRWNQTSAIQVTLADNRATPTPVLFPDGTRVGFSAAPGGNAIAEFVMVRNNIVRTGVLRLAFGVNGSGVPTIGFDDEYTESESVGITLYGFYNSSTNRWDLFYTSTFTAYATSMTFSFRYLSALTN